MIKKHPIDKGNLVFQTCHLRPRYYTLSPLIHKLFINKRKHNMVTYNLITTNRRHMLYYYSFSCAGEEFFDVARFFGTTFLYDFMTNRAIYERARDLRFRIVSQYNIKIVPLKIILTLTSFNFFEDPMKIILQQLKSYTIT